jgi:hypothetical protein
MGTRSRQTTGTYTKTNTHMWAFDIVGVDSGNETEVEMDFSNPRKAKLGDFVGQLPIISEQFLLINESHYGSRGYFTCIGT